MFDFDFGTCKTPRDIKSDIPLHVGPPIGVPKIMVHLVGARLIGISGSMRLIQNDVTKTVTVNNPNTICEIKK